MIQSLTNVHTKCQVGIFQVETHAQSDLSNRQSRQPHTLHYQTNRSQDVDQKNVHKLDLDLYLFGVLRHTQ